VGRISHLVNRERLYVSSPAPLVPAIEAEAAMAATLGSA
jgi:hypothetical protein